MSGRVKTGFVAGVVGAAILAAIMYSMTLAGLGGTPGFVGIYRSIFGPSPTIEHVVGAAGFGLAGGIWGLLFAALVRRPGVLKGMAFGLLPTLFLWLVLAPATGQPLFNGFTPRGVLLPLLFNVVVWGSFVGWYCGRKYPTA